MRRATLILIALVALTGVAVARVSASTGKHPAKASTAVAPEVRLYPAVALRGRNATITVTHLEARSLEVRVVGATTNLGRPLAWTPLHYEGRAWHGLLASPEFRGVYPLELRIRRDSPVLSSEHWLLRVFARGTQSRPSFRTPEGVARGWSERCRSTRSLSQ